MKRTYSDKFKAHALAELQLNGGNVKDTARKLKILRSTLLVWRDKSLAVQNIIPADTKQKRIDLWDKTQNMAANRLQELIPKSDNVRDVAYAGGIALNAFLDLKDGRKGTEVHVDASTKSVTFVQGAIQAAIQVKDGRVPQALGTEPLIEGEVIKEELTS